MACQDNYIGKTLGVCVTLLLLFSISLCKNKDMENWVKIKHVKKDGYFVSDLGRIKVIKRSGEVIKIGSLRQDGYRMVATGHTDYWLVHVLVIENFSERPDWAECVNHINGVKDDNRLENLEYSTIKLNNLHAFNTGLNKTVGAVGVNHHLARNIEEVHKIYELKKAGLRVCDIARQLNKSPFLFIRVYKGIDWKYEYQKFFT